MIATNENISQIIDRLLLETHLATDTETYGLAYGDQLFSFGVSTANEAFYFNFKDYPDEGIYGLEPSAFIIAQIQRLFSAKHITWFLHNTKFDMHKYAHSGLYIEGTWWDCKVHARILQNNLLSYKLDALTKNQVNRKSPEVDEYVKKHGLKSKQTIAGKKKILTLLHFDKVPFSVMSNYALKDCLCTFELGMSQVKAYESRPALHRLRDNENALIKVIFKMERNGIKIDPEYVIKAWDKEKRVLHDARAAFRGLTGADLDDTTKLDLVKILSDAGENISYKEETGNPILDSAALEKMSSPVAELVNKVRYYEKRIASFYSTFLQLRDHYNSIHANIDQAGTETGRFSMSNPNLQQLSKDEDGTEEYSVRGCFVPQEGTVFVQFDYSQQEYRILADYANEKGLLTKIAAGYDVHQATAELVGVTRSEAKTINFALLYGAGPAKIAASLKISVAEAKKLIEKYYAAMPMVENFIARVRGVGAQRGSIFNWLGRVCNIANRDWSYILPNHLIQGSGADVCKRALVEIDKLLESVTAQSKIVLTVHDSVVMQMISSEYFLLPRIKEIMETVYEARNGVVLKVDVEHSFNSLAKKDLIKGYPNEQEPRLQEQQAR